MNCGCLLIECRPVATNEADAWRIFLSAVAQPIAELAMFLNNTYPLDAATATEIWRDQTEQQIIRAYVQLALPPNLMPDRRTVTLERFGALEVRLTEIPQSAGVLPSLPPFWLEIHSHASNSTIDSCGCFEFDEDELVTAVEFILNARQRYQSGN